MYDQDTRNLLLINIVLAASHFAKIKIRTRLKVRQWVNRLLKK